jgi:hypothetical protein
MPRTVTSLAELLDARHVVRGVAGCPRPAGRWSLEALRGRLVEIRAASASGQLTAALLAVRDAQRRGEVAAWVTSERSSFYPPDAARAGVDLDALIVVRLEGAERIPRAADRLLRSGAVGAVVLDLASDERGAGLKAPQASRLAGLARKHDAAVLLLGAGGEEGGLGPLVSLCGEARRLRGGGLEIRALRDKRGAASLRHVEPCRGPAGLR